MACYERENRFRDSNWSKSVLHRRRRASPNCPAHFHVYDMERAVGGPEIAMTPG